eukprot:11142697-Alexandrium_andersonii.AAC.1
MALCLPRNLCLVVKVRAVGNAVKFTADLAGLRTSGPTSGWPSWFRAGTPGGSRRLREPSALALRLFSQPSF